MWRLSRSEAKHWERMSATVLAVSLLVGALLAGAGPQASAAPSSRPLTVTTP